MLPHIIAPNLNIPVVPLTQDSFAPFGTVVENPANATGRSQELKVVKANQGSALKYIDVSHVSNFYHLAPSNKPARAVIHRASSNRPVAVQISVRNRNRNSQYRFWNDTRSLLKPLFLSASLPTMRQRSTLSLLLQHCPSHPKRRTDRYHTLITPRDGDGA